MFVARSAYVIFKLRRSGTALGRICLMGLYETRSRVVLQTFGSYGAEIASYLRSI